MFRHILVPLDLTEHHQRAVEIAAGLAHASGGRVTLLHVIELIPGLVEEEDQRFYQRLERKAQTHLQTLLPHLEQRGVAAAIQVLLGPRAQEIVRYAMDQQVDLIVLTSHRVDLANPAVGWGTLSYKISILAQCPILLVK
ncbi:MAG: universal stress protein [Gemmataceae bacterium]